ncbi:MAG TPA: hypothetical protein V6D19_04435 [Stenomitos sp.]
MSTGHMIGLGAKTAQHNTGFTLIELLVSALAACIILVALLGLVTTQQREVVSDRDRTIINNNLETALTLIGDDIKQAGEGLEQQSELPVISVLDGSPTGQPDTLIVQRKRLTEALTICQAIDGSNNTVEVAAWGNTVSTCPSTATTVADVPNLNRWQTFRCQQDGIPGCEASPPPTCTQVGGTNNECLWAYIYDPDPLNTKPVNQRGEFFLISGESRASCSSNLSLDCWRITRADGRPWQYRYEPRAQKDTQPRLYVLEQKTYQLIPDTNTPRPDDSILTLWINNQRDASNQPLQQRVANQLQDLQFRVRTGTNTWNTAFNADQVYASDWQSITGIEIELKGLNGKASQLSDPILTLQSIVFPRNVTSVRPLP